MRIKWLVLLIVLAVCANSVPSQISFQGVLKDSTTGTPITGSREITFTIFGSPIGPGHSWTETQTVSIEAGLYNVQLNAPASAFDGTTKYLGISIGGSELLPRVLMVSVPYAYRADQATYADTAGSSGGFPNSVLLSPGTAQTTTAAGAIWVKSSASGIENNTVNVISIESTGDYAFAAQYKRGSMIGKIVGTTGSQDYTGAMFQYSSAVGAFIGIREFLVNPYFVNYGGAFYARGMENEIGYGLLAGLSEGNTYGYAAKFSGGIGVILPDSTGEIAGLAAIYDPAGTSEGTVRYDSTTHDFFGWTGTTGDGGKGWVKLNN